jgi:predicted RNA binding protein YcfA (HicA-like mRNA interferase family)
MCRLPSISAREAIRAFEKDGFVEVRKSASHCLLRKPGHPHALSIPCHGNRDLGKGLLRSLIRTAGLTVEQFVALLD